MSKRNRDYIIQNIRESVSGDEGAKLYTITDIAKGTTEAVVEKTVVQRMPIQDIDKAEDLYDRLTCGDGRRVYTPEDLAHPYNPTH